MRPWAAALSGALLVAAFPHLDQGWVALFALVPLLMTFPQTTPGRAFGSAFLTGFVFFAGLLYWIMVFTRHVAGTPVGVAAWIALAVFQALYVGVFGLLANAVYRRNNPVMMPLGVAGAWVFTEWLRQLGPIGMGWGDIGYSQWHYPIQIGIANVAGIWGVSFLVVAINVAIASRNRRSLAMASVLLLSCWLITLLTVDVPAHKHVIAAAIQPDINENVVWAGARPRDEAYFQNLVSSLGAAVTSAPHPGVPTLCVLPETIVPGYPAYDTQLHDDMSQWARSGAVVVAGARDFNFRTRMERNIAYSVLPDGSFAGLYAKSQLVPFGEFIPYQQYLPSLGALHMTAMDMVPGGRDQAALPATPEIGKVGMMICYESTYPRFSRQQVRAGATVLAVITDDTWFGRTAAAKQHLAMSALRAVETDRFVVRSAATGISAIFAPDGTMLADAPLFRQAIVEQYIAPLHDTTLFVRYGDWLVWVGIVLLLVAVFG